ncbi:unnamed protein product [Clonostachys rosea]|uniref:Uncharacterized protein n=1 Tax=Bionectria ochroleuca TaxID=29856 RepID=A0ABY6TUQ7_BIOOC|nr:unnamed protein product [Clonostachys rosea]
MSEPEELEGVLDDLLQLTDPLGTNSAVNDLVVEASGDGDLVVPLNAGLLSLGGDGNLLGGADGNNGGLGRVDDSSEVVNSGVHAHLVLALRRGVESLAELQQLGDGEGAGDEEVGVGLDRLLEAAGNDLAHAGDGNVLESGSRGSSRRWGAAGLLDILLGDLAALASALDLLNGDTALTGQTLGLGSGVGLTVKSGLQTTSRRVLLGLGGGLGGGSGSGLGLRLLLLLRSGRSGITASILESELLESIDVGAFLDENSDRLNSDAGQNRNLSRGKIEGRNVLGTRLLEDLGDHTLLLELKVHLGLVGLDLNKNITGCDAVTGLLLPGANVASLHSWGEGGHLDDLVVGERGVVADYMCPEACSQGILGGLEGLPPKYGAEHCERGGVGDELRLRDILILLKSRSCRLLADEVY